MTHQALGRCRCGNCHSIEDAIALNQRHGQLPAPNVGQLLEPDPEVYLAGGPLAPDHCECDGVCECENDGENPRYGPGNPDWEHDRDKDIQDD